MMGSIAKKLFGSRNDRVVKSYAKIVDQVNALEDSYGQLSDEDLKGKTAEFRLRLDNDESLDSLIPEAFATVREAGKRVMGMRHYDVQLIGGMVLNDGRIAEMRTGEGKTLVATLTAYLNALPSKGVHVITVNDYLASRDAEWMSKLYGFLGLTTGIIVSGLDQDARQEAYASDITYGTNNEFGFDYLRDNMAFSKEERVQRPLSYAVVDEVDSILIDEARTPLIISGPSSESANLYEAIDKVVPSLTPQAQDDEEGPGDYLVDEKSKQVFLTDAGNERVEELLQEAGIIPEGEGLFDSSSISVLHHLNAALRAHTLFELNVDYLISDGEIIIVDEFTGRTMPGRRWSEGLHQAIEAKEGVDIKPENQTMASITFQNYFRLYEKLSGMTGTADTEAFELQQIYDLEVVVIPTNMPAVRKDENDLVYMSQNEKYDAIVEDINDAQKRQQPVLVGTASIDSSEILSGKLTEAKIKHEVLNAKQHEREAHIIENAGRPGAVTIATNMAGRGTDIVLGGSLEAELGLLGDDDAAKTKVKADWQTRHETVVASGGLHIIGTERHESRRVDNQLRGRSGRQGDPGSSRFFLSLEDSLMRIFASEKVKGIMKKLGMEKGQAIEARIVSKSIENAQRKVEGHNYDIRKNLLEYDDVANDQRKVVYQQRSELLEGEDVQESVESIRFDVVDTIISRYVPPASLDEQWDIPGLTASLEEEFGLVLEIQDWLDKDDSLHEEPLRERIQSEVDKTLKSKESLIGEENMRKLERDVMLHVLDEEWKEHLASMDYLRQSVGLRGYAQKNPKQEYKREAFEMFEDLLDRIKLKVVSFLMKIQITQEAPQEIATPEPDETPMEYSHAQASNVLGDDSGQDSASGETTRTYQRIGEKVGRNDACPCGSGKKFKQCHGQLK